MTEHITPNALRPFVAGIDPGASTGVAIWSRKTDKILDWFTSDFVRVQHLLRSIFPNKEDLKIYIELPHKMMFENQAKAKAVRNIPKSRDQIVAAVGGNRRESQLLLLMLKDQGWDVEHVPPVNEKKWDQQRFELACKTNRQASEHERDAARLAMVNANKGRY